MHTFLKRFSAPLAAALTLVFAASQPAGAQATNEQLFISFLSSPGYLAFIEQSLAGTDPAPLKAECPRMTVTGQPKYAVVRPAAFTVTNGQGAITDGVWVALVPVDRCGTLTVRRLLIAVTGPNNLSPSRLLPGEFRGDLRLEADVQRTVLPLFVELAQCPDEKAVFISDVKAISETPQAWSEHWSANACGKQVAILVHYARSGNAINFETELPVEAKQPAPFQPFQAAPMQPIRPAPLPTRPGQLK